MGIEVAVVGAGRWGSALGQTAARNGHTVTLWSPRKGLPDVEGCRRTQDLADVAGKRAILFTVPPEHARTIARELAACSGATLRHEPRPEGGSLFRIVFADPQRWEA
jgi:glycerol-3-phosphate dehydrogenase